MMLLMDAAVVEELVAHAEDEHPHEACGVMAGKEEENGVRIMNTYRVRNAHPEPDLNYTLDPEEHLSVLHQMDDAALDLVGYYHSHPQGPDGPSVIDAARSPWPGVAYVVISFRETWSLTAWMWDAEARTFRQERIQFD